MLYRFDCYAVDVDRRELRRETDVVAVEPQVFDILEFLLRNHGRVVTKQELLTAIWDRRFVSDSTLSSRLSAVRHAIADTGGLQRFIRTIPRKGYRFVGQVWTGDLANLPAAGAEADRNAWRGQLSVPDTRPVVTVLPFNDVSRAPDHHDLGKTISDAMADALSRFRHFSIVARNPFGGSRDADHHTDYVIEGTVNRDNGRVRIAARLTDADAGRIIWTERVDCASDDAFSLQDRIIRTFVGAFASRLESAELARLRRAPTEPDSYTLTLRGMANLYRWNKTGIDEAFSLFGQAFARDPECGRAYAMAAYCYVQRASYGWLTDRPRDMADTIRLARRAAELGSDDACTMARAAHAIAAVGRDLDTGALFIEQALKLNPLLAMAWYVSGWVKLFLGEPRAALEHLARAAELAHFDPLIFKIRGAISYAHFFAGHYEEAAGAAGQALALRPGYLTASRAAAASHARAGRIQEGQRLMSQMRRLDPSLRLSTLQHLIPLREDHFARWSEALLRAGLPN